MEFDKLFKRYVWDDDRTPYLVPVGRLNRRQADYEVLAYTLFLGILFGVVTVGSLSGSMPTGRSSGAAVYGFSVVCAAVLFGMTKNLAAACYLGLTPLVGLAWLLLGGFASARERIDTIIVAGVLILLTGYSLRIVALARAYPGMPEPTDDGNEPRRRRFRR